jgi:hypothetical protein
MTALERQTTDQLPYVSEGQGWDDDEEDLPVRPVRKRLGPFSLLLIGAVVAAGAFYGGVVTEKNHVTATTVSAAAASRARTAATTAGAPGAAGAAGAAGRTGTAGAAGAAGAAGGAGGAGATFGTVKLIDGTNVYVQDATGNITKVATTAQSTITITSTGTTKNIKPGDTVVVTGPTGADGTVNATSIRDAGAGGAALGGLGGFGGRNRGAGGAAGGGAAAGAPAGGFGGAGG